MKTVSKKLLCLLMVVFLLAAAIPFQAFASETGTEPQVTESKETKPEETKPEETKPEETKPEETKPEETKPEETKPEETKPEETKPEETKPEETKPEETKPEETEPKEVILTLDAGDGTIDKIGGSTTTFKLTKNSDGTYNVPELPNASLSGYTFKGWFVDGSRIENGRTFLTESATAVAKYDPMEKNLLVKGVKTTQKAEDAVLICGYPVPIGNQLLAYVNREDVSNTVRNSVPAGYSLVNNNGAILWYSSNGKELTSQATATDKAQTVLVKYQANKYTLYFQVDGGSVSPTSKEVTFDQKVGTLPTPTRKGDVFLGWYDEDGNRYTKDTVYKVAGDTTLKAYWKSQAEVWLWIYMDGNLKKADRILNITGKVAGTSVKQSEVEKLILEKYSAQSGKTMKLVGLFNDDTWEDYKAGKVKTGDPNVTILEDAQTNVYVVVKNAKQGGTSTSTDSTTKPVDKTNPKTGDTMLIYTAASVMVLAGAALVTVQAVRKRKQF